MKYWVQTKAPAGNWVDSIGVSDETMAVEYAIAFQEKNREPVRVVERTDVEIWVAK